MQRAAVRMALLNYLILNLNNALAPFEGPDMLTLSASAVSSNFLAPRAEHTKGMRLTTPARTMLRITMLMRLTARQPAC